MCEWGLQTRTLEDPGGGLGLRPRRPRENRYLRELADLLTLRSRGPLVDWNRGAGSPTPASGRSPPPPGSPLPRSPPPPPRHYK